MIRTPAGDLHVREVAPDLWHYRRDPASPMPDFVCRSLGEVLHLQVTGHVTAKGCCPLADVNGRHILPQHRRPA